jgi:hypothetical protein
VRKIVEMLEPGWRSPEAKMLYDLLQIQIAEAFAIPTDARYSPQELNSFMAEAYRATEAIRNEAIRLYLECSFPRCVIKQDEGTRK